MGVKGGAIGNTIGEHIGNLKGTCWEQKKNEKKKSSPSPTQNLKNKKIKALMENRPAHPLRVELPIMNRYLIIDHFL